jgi:hypothetical protein
MNLLVNATGTTAVPSAATDGVAIHRSGANVNGIQSAVKDLNVLVKATGTAGFTLSLRLWVYHSEIADWLPVGLGTGATRGLLNQAALTETGTSGTITAYIPLSQDNAHGQNIRNAERVYLQVSAVSGTLTRADAWLIGR